MRFFNTKVVRASTSVILAGKGNSCRHSTMNFSENVVVVKTSYRKVTSFIILRSGEGLLPSIKITVLTFLVQKK